MEKERWEDSKLWVGMEIRSGGKKKKEKDEKQMESATDMTASSPESEEPPLVQLHGVHLLHLHLYDPSKRCHMLAFELLSPSLRAFVRVCVRVQHIRWSDRRCLSWRALHGSGMPLVEEDHVHCVNRDNSDLIGLQADSFCILIGQAPNVSPPPSWHQPWWKIFSFFLFLKIYFHP